LYVEKITSTSKATRAEEAGSALEEHTGQDISQMSGMGGK
jgi:hypothetical protein